MALAKHGIAFTTLLGLTDANQSTLVMFPSDPTVTKHTSLVTRWIWWLLSSTGGSVIPSLMSQFVDLT
jgi:hypothetical protein